MAAIRKRLVSIRQLKGTLKSTIEEELLDIDNRGVVDSIGIISDHLNTINEGSTSNILSFQMAFVGLLHVVTESSKMKSNNSIHARLPSLPL